MDEKIKGLSMGAVDYIYKPFSIDELLAKIDAIIQNQKIKRALYEKDKFASLGMLTGGIAHEVLNPLSAVKAPIQYIEMIMKETEGLRSAEEAIRLFNSIYKNLERAEGIIKNLKNLFYHSEIKTEQLDVEEVIRSLIRIFKNKVKDRINIEYQSNDNSGLIGNKDVLTQILINLISNAIDAIEGIGEIKIKTEERNGHLRISVSDTGKGIPKKEIDTIFNAFYTTKEVGKGTGLGLYITREMALKMGWEIEVYSEIGKGSEFIITA